MKKIIAIMLAALMLCHLQRAAKPHPRTKTPLPIRYPAIRLPAPLITKRQQALPGKLQLCLQPAVLATKPITIPSMPA